MVTYGVKQQRSDDLRLDRHPEGCSEATFDDWCANALANGERLAVDLFCGAGGLSLGLEKAGWKVAVAVDNDNRALETHRHNFPGLALAQDLGEPGQRRDLIARLKSTTVDLVAGGPPCQPFSRAGRSKIRSLVLAGHREEHDHRRELWQAFLDVGLAVRPRAILMENVPDMALGDDFAVVRTMIDALERAGYHVQLRLVDAWRYGVPQHRKRLALLARNDLAQFIWPPEYGRRPTLEDAIGDLPKLGHTIGGRVLPYQHNAQRMSQFAETMRTDMPDDVVWDHMTRPVREDDREVFGIMDASTLYGDLPADKRRYSADTFDDKYKKLDWTSLSRSITAHIAKDGYWYIHPQELRTLTVREAARVQTFPDRFRFAGRRSDAFRQIGNAVPPMLGYAASAALHPMPDEQEGQTAERACRSVVARQAITTWAKQQRRGRYWHALPGRSVTPLVAAVAATLMKRAAPPRGAEEALAVVRGQVRPSKSDLEQMLQVLPPQAGSVLLERFRPLLPKRRVWSEPEELAEQLEMTPTERNHYRLLCGNDVLLATQSTIRVAARIAGSESDKLNRMSDGRADLARVVGAGPDAPLRAAALRLIGNTVCRNQTPQCGDCPLREYCPTGSESKTKQAVS